MNICTNSKMSKNSKPFDEALTLTGFGKFNLFSVIATGGSLMCVIIETMNAMFLSPAAQCDLNLSLTDKGLLSSAGFLGVVASSHIWGYIADTSGRKKVVLLSLTISAAISLIGSFITITWLYILLRFFNGFFIGGSSAIIYAYVGEFHDNHYRQKVVSWIACFIAFGNMYVPGMAWLLLPQNWVFEIPLLGVMFRPWRLLMIVYAIPSLISAACVYFLPESPKYLLTQGKKEEVLDILRRIFSINTGKGGHEYPVSELLWEENNEIHHKHDEGVLTSMWKQTKPLFTKVYYFRTIIACFLQFSIFYTTSAVSMWYPEILNTMSEYEKRVPSRDEITMCLALTYSDDDPSLTNACVETTNADAFVNPLYLAVGFLLIYLFMGSIINRVGPRAFTAVLICFSTISGILAQTLYGYEYVQICLACFLMCATTITSINALVVDLYPTQIRGMALAISLMFGRLGAMAGSNTGGLLMYSYCDYMFYIFAAIQGLTIICVILMPSQNSPKKKILFNTT